MEVAGHVALGAAAGAEQTPKEVFLWQPHCAAIKAERKKPIQLWRGNETSDELMRHQKEILDYQDV